MPHLDCRSDNQNDLDKFNNSNKSGNWLVWYHADWCGHCKRMVDQWNNLKNNLGKNVHTAKVQDEVVNKLNYKAQIQGFPTIEMRRDGHKIAEYNGDRTAEDLMKFAMSNSRQKGGRKVRSNKGKKRNPYGPRSGKTRSGKRFRPVPVVKKSRKVRSNKGKKRVPYGRRTGKTRSGKKFRMGGGLMDMVQSGMDRYENLVGNYHH